MEIPYQNQVVWMSEMTPSTDLPCQFLPDESQKLPVSKNLISTDILSEDGGFESPSSNLSWLEKIIAKKGFMETCGF